MRAGIMLAVALFAVWDASAEPIAPELFGSIPTVSEAEISPDGKMVAQIQSVGGVRAVAFYNLDGSAPPMGVELGDVKARALRWVSPDNVLTLVSASTTVAWGHGLETHEIWRWVSIDRNTGKPAYLLSSYLSGRYFFGAGKIFSILPSDPNFILMGQGGSLYRVNLQTGLHKLEHRGEHWTTDWVVDGSGEPVVRIDYDSDKEERQFYRRRPGGRRFDLASALKEKREEDEKLIAFAIVGSESQIHGAMNIDGYYALCVFDVDKGEASHVDLAIPGYDISAAVTDPNTGVVIGVHYTDDLPRTRFINAKFQKIQEELEKALPGATPVITSWSDDQKKFVVRVEYTDHPPQIFLFDRDKRSLSMLTATYAALDGEVFAAKEKYDYVSPDGLTIPGYLTVPAGAGRRQMPLIVLPHGGPEARDDQTFDWWSFFYAARGYLVYQPNFRGSDGYGEAFRQAGYLEWGRKMQDDITEGVRHLIADGFVDPSRICIVGGSYGGYAALAGATLTPDLYACAVSVAGVSSIPALIAYQTDSGAVPEDAWDVRIGARVSDNDQLRAVSPYYQAQNVRAPILLIHGKDDVVVPIGQSRLMRDALEKANKEVDLVELTGEDHWLSRGETRTEMLARSIEFIDKYIGTDANLAAN